MSQFGKTIPGNIESDEEIWHEASDDIMDVINVDGKMDNTDSCSDNLDESLSVAMKTLRTTSNVPTIFSDVDPTIRTNSRSTSSSSGFKTSYSCNSEANNSEEVPKKRPRQTARKSTAGIWRCRCIRSPCKETKLAQKKRVSHCRKCGWPILRDRRDFKGPPNDVDRPTRLPGDKIPQPPNDFTCEQQRIAWWTYYRQRADILSDRIEKLSFL